MVEAGVGAAAGVEGVGSNVGCHWAGGVDIGISPLAKPGDRAVIVIRLTEAAHSAPPESFFWVPGLVLGRLNLEQIGLLTNFVTP